MKVAFITNKRAPYRILQFNEFAKIENIKLTVYYTHKESENRKWETKKSIGYNEIYLLGKSFFSGYGYINKGLVNLVKNNELVIIGGYEQPTYIILSILCRLFNKPYVISFDGISTNRLSEQENKLKKIVKNMVIKNSSYILGNGTVSKEYFSRIYKYPVEKIYNQYLTVDSVTINKLYENKEIYRKEYREKYNISNEEKVLLYSGRLIEVKNIKIVIKAISELKKDNITFVILGGGDLEEDIIKLANELDVKMIVTGFIEKQTELFKHYYIGDCFILPSLYEPWGLVVNEAMFSGLPVLISGICGCSLDLVHDGENGYKINPIKIEDIKIKIINILYKDNYIKMGLNSRSIIENWTFISSRKELEIVIENIRRRKYEPSSKCNNSNI